MAHYIEVTENLDRDVGISTHVKFEAGKVLVTWKRGEYRVISANIGDRLQILTGGGFPEVRVMRPPKGELERIAWGFNFFSKKRVKTLEELEQKAKAEYRYSRPHGYDIPAAAVYHGEKCAVCYHAVMEGQIGVPWLWWAEADADSNELKRIIQNALNTGTLNVFH